jgi:hypothetical protein
MMMMMMMMMMLNFRSVHMSARGVVSSVDVSSLIILQLTLQLNDAFPGQVFKARGPLSLQPHPNPLENYQNIFPISRTQNLLTMPQIQPLGESRQLQHLWSKIQVARDWVVKIKNSGTGTSTVTIRPHCCSCNSTSMPALDYWQDEYDPEPTGTNLPCGFVILVD